MDFEVFLSPEALIDLERIVVFISLENAVAAEQMGHQLLDTALSLRTFPERGRVVPEFGLSHLREIVFRTYRIIYRLNNKIHRIEVVRFWHGARGFPQIPGPDARIAKGILQLTMQSGSCWALAAASGQSAHGREQKGRVHPPRRHRGNASTERRGYSSAQT